jgi:hypothetical protein
LPPLGDFSRGVDGLAALSAACAARGLFTFADRVPDCGLAAFAFCCCCSCSSVSLSFLCFQAFNDVG